MVGKTKSKRRKNGIHGIRIQKKTGWALVGVSLLGPMSFTFVIPNMEVSAFRGRLLENRQEWARRKETRGIHASVFGPFHCTIMESNIVQKTE